MEQFTKLVVHGNPSRDSGLFIAFKFLTSTISSTSAKHYYLRKLAAIHQPRATNTYSNPPKWYSSREYQLTGTCRHAGDRVRVPIPGQCTVAAICEQEAAAYHLVIILAYLAMNQELTLTLRDDISDLPSETPHLT